jgi:rhodanese-related sulfurtransferase
MGVINRAGPRPVDLSMPKPVDPEELRRRIEAGEWVVDLRERTAFAAGHLGGTVGFELSGSFATYLGWLYEWGAPLTLIGDDADQIADARRELARIGIDDLAGAAVGEIHTLVDGSELRSYRVADFHALTDAIDDSGVRVLDVRQEAEYTVSHIDGAVNIPLHQLALRPVDVPVGTVWIHCGSGYRASIAASMIDRVERTVVLVNDQFANAQALGLAK